MSIQDILLQQLANGLILGSFYALVALGYTMVYGIIKLLNFAHGDLYMIGAFIGFLFLSVLSPLIGDSWVGILCSMVLSMIAVGLLGVLIQRIAYQPMLSAPRLSILITALGDITDNRRVVGIGHRDKHHLCGGVGAVIGAANSYMALMWGSLLGMLTAALLSLVQRIMTLEQVVNAWYKGMRSMIYAMIILILAWALGGIAEELQTADYLVSLLGDTLPAQLLPVLVFIIAAFTAFATGSSWGAMGILVPLVIPLTWAVMKANGLDAPSDMHILFSAIASVLAGSVWGDHCSPISDTTVLSSIASGCDHIEHVRTQLPYALLVGFVAIGIGTIPAGYGVPPWISLIVGAAILLTVLRFFGRSADESVN